MTEFIPFALPDIGEEEIAEVVDSLRSGWLTTGPKTKRFEQEFADFIGSGVEAIAVNSATSGLHLALEALGIGPGDEVITTVHTFTATAEVIRYLGANPVFVDIDLATMNIDVSKIEAAITSRTKAIIPVHFGGLACDMKSILTIAQKHKLKVVEDAAHAIPTTYQGKLIGSLDSDVTVYSFYATKTIATGEGGMLVTRNPEIAKRCRTMRLHGINRDAFDRYTSTKPSWYYEVIAPGFKYNMTDVAASLGIHQLKKVRILQQQRDAIANRYNIELASLPLHLPAPAPDGDIHSWHLYVIHLADSVQVNRNRFIEQLAAKGIGCSVHYIPLHLHPYWRETYNLRSEDFPQASYAYQRIVSLPIYTKMTEADQTHIIKIIKKTLT
ncbi:MAG: DegT/DnrJ/EryC1/StrS family aminotransferase [Nostoc sp.]|uniref:DegT/DnrJ/EryC1/StrS family aminotransferase n=1 Tax=Nostoc sp. TaxID=1180 RepID=UPI002FFAB265